MGNRFSAAAGCFIVLLSLAISTSQATTVNLGETSEASGNDSNNDGTWDTLLPGPSVDLLAYNGVSSNSFSYNYRGAVEFNIGSLPHGAVIQSATLVMEYDGTSGVSGQTLQFNGFAGTGIVRLQDFQTQSQIGPRYSTLGPGDGTDLYKVPATAFVQSLVNGHDPYAGFTVENVVFNQTLLGGFLAANPPLLEITYTPEPTSLSLLLSAVLLRRPRRIRS